MENVNYHNRQMQAVHKIHDKYHVLTSILGGILLLQIPTES